MKNFLVIGQGRFGRHLARKLLSLGNEVMIVDRKEENLREIMPIATGAQVGDCARREVMQTLGVSSFDACFVCIGTDFQSSLEISDLLKEMGAKRVISRASMDTQEKFLLRCGADEVIYPERDLAEKLAVRASMDNIFSYIELPGEIDIFEIAMPTGWVGHTIRDLNVRVNYNVSILAVLQGDKLNTMPSIDVALQKEEHLMVMGRQADVARIQKK